MPSVDCAADARRLELDAEAMRRLGYAAIDMLVDHVAALGTGPLVATADGSDPGLGIADLPFPAAPQDPMAALALVRERVLADVIPVSDPRFFAYIPGPGNFVGAMAEVLSAGVNIFAGTAKHAQGPTEVELATIRWLAGLAGLPEQAGGLFVSGGSMANLTALAVARHHRLGEDMTGARIYCSSETHSSVDRALRVLGFQSDQLVRLAADASLRLDPAALRDRIAADRAAGLRPFLVVGNAGTTSTGTVDPLGALADIVAGEDLWLHVDAAYGGAALLVDEARALLAGIERAHSVTMDPHKWFFQPFDCGALLVRDMHWLYDAFHVLPAYLRDSAPRPGRINYRDHGIELTRGLRALKLWLSLQTFGTDAFRAAIRHGMNMAERAEAALRTRPHWRIVSPASLAMLAFRHEPPDADSADLDRRQLAIAETVLARDEAFLSTTEIAGRRTLRMCTINPRLDAEQIDGVVEALDAAARDLRA
ncbi:MAG: aminotransferase class I/II-fold pyridoxal phosphate-dependent enzyme [Alphaproteobacteria bacterium]|nr:MAG: aminotransferase class I/II-fold pyridoxal phosphate-dependent enzyme [Alphaproteobacteria bacterium]